MRCCLRLSLFFSCSLPPYYLPFIRTRLPFYLPLLPVPVPLIPSLHSVFSSLHYYNILFVCLLLAFFTMPSCRHLLPPMAPAFCRNTVLLFAHTTHFACCAYAHNTTYAFSAVLSLTTFSRHWRAALVLRLPSGVVRGERRNAATTRLPPSIWLRYLLAAADVECTTAVPFSRPCHDLPRLGFRSRACL